MIHNDPLRTIDIIAIERDARRLRAEAVATAFRAIAAWARGKLVGPARTTGQTA
jgi:hypothetical protein